MKKYKQVQKTEKELEKVVCDNPNCGKVITGDDLRYGKWSTLSYSGGYTSEWPGDLRKAEADLCEECIKEILEDKCRIRKTKILSR